LTTAVGGASRFSLSREEKKFFVIRLTPGLHPGLQIFHPSGIWKRNGTTEFDHRRWRGKQVFSFKRGKERFVIHLTPGLHPGLELFHPSGIWKRIGDTEFDHRRWRGKQAFSFKRGENMPGVSLNPGFTPRAINISSLRDLEEKRGHRI